VVQAQQENLLTNVYVEALRQLAPDMGAYQNEVGPEWDEYEDKEVDCDDPGEPIRAQFSAVVLGRQLSSFAIYKESSRSLGCVLGSCVRRKRRVGNGGRCAVQGINKSDDEQKRPNKQCVSTSYSQHYFLPKQI
jgi:hypothetical protein